MKTLTDTNSTETTATFKPFPVGTVRGPYAGSYAGKATGGVHFMVQGPNGWVPFIGPQHEESIIRRKAEAYAQAILAESAV